MDNLKEIKNKLENNGWAIVRNVFAKEEVHSLRNKVFLSEQQGYNKGDLLSNPNLGHVIYDERILKIVAEILGKEPVYFGDSGYQIASVLGRISSGFHKDCVDRDDQNGPDWKSPYTIIRIGLYLQDHANHSEGLILRTGSHKYIDLTKGEKVNADTKPGDIVIWYHTTSHSGNAKRIKLINYPVLGFDGTKSFSSMLYFRLQKYANFMIQKAEKDRMAIFMSFGINDHHLDRNIKYLKNRRYAVKNWQNSKYSPELLDRIKGKKLTVLSMYDVVKDVNLNEIGEANYALKY